MIHIVIGYNGERVEYPEDQARWLAMRSTIIECKVVHFRDFHSHETYDPSEYTIYHPGSRSGRMISLQDIQERLKEMPW